MKRAAAMLRAVSELGSAANVGRVAAVGLVCNLAIHWHRSCEAAIPLLLLAYLLLVLATGGEIFRPNRHGFWSTFAVGWLHVAFFSSLLFFQLSLELSFPLFLLMMTGGWEFLSLGELVWPRRLAPLMMIFGFLAGVLIFYLAPDSAAGVPTEVVETFFARLFIPFDLLMLPLLALSWKRAVRRPAKLRRCSDVASAEPHAPTTRG